MKTITNKKTFFAASVLLTFTLYFLSKSGVGTAIYEFVSNYGEGVIDPLEYLSVLLVATTFILLFFSDQVFKLWLRKIMLWFAPLAILIIALGSTEVDYAWPTRTSLAIFFGGILVIITLVFALIQRFYYKK